MGVPSIVMPDIEEWEWDIDTKDDEEGDRWCEAPESKTQR